MKRYSLQFIIFWVCFLLVSIGPVSALEIDQISGYNNLDGIDLQSNIQYSLDGDMHNTLFNSANLSENEVYILNSMNPSSNVTKVWKELILQKKISKK